MPAHHVLLFTVLLVSCGPAAVPVPTVVPSAPAAAAPVPLTPTVLWTSPPGAATAPTPAPSPAPPPVAVSPAAPAPTPRPTPSPRPTSTVDAFQWTEHAVNNGGPVVYLPATWTVVDPALAFGGFAFGASPESPRPLAQYTAFVSLDWFSAAPALTLDGYASAYASTIAMFHPGSQRGTHPAGPAVFFSYRDSAAYQHVDAIVAAAGRIVTLRSRAPVDRWAAYDSTFAQIFRRLRPA